MQQITTPVEPARVVHAGCPYCFKPPPHGTQAAALCGQAVTFHGLKTGDGTEGTDCPACMQVAETVYEDGCCRNCCSR